jgi:polysaccharide biosynthesis transport protein
MDAKPGLPVLAPKATAPIRTDLQSAQAPDALALLKALRRRWPLALILGVLSGALGAGGAYLFVPPSKYMAQSKLHVATFQPKILLETAEQRSEFRTYQKTQEAMIRSRGVLSKALAAPEVARMELVRRQLDPLEWLERELQIDFANGSEIMRIAMSSHNAGEPAVLVNAVTRAYLDEVVNEGERERQLRVDIMTKQWKDYQETLRSKRVELRKQAALAGSDNQQVVALIRSSKQDNLARAEDDLSRLRNEIRTLEIEAAVQDRQRELAESSVSPATVTATVAQDPTIAKLSQRISQLRSQFNQVGAVARDRMDPAAQKLRKEYDDAQAELARQRDEITPNVARRLADQASGELRTKAELTSARLKILAGFEEKLLDDVKRLQGQTDTITKAAKDLSEIQEEIATAEGIAKRIGVEVESMKLEFKAPARVRLVELAETPRTKDEKKQIKAAGIAGMGSLFAALVGVTLFEFRARRIDSAAEVSLHLGLRVVGVLPIQPSTRNRLIKVSESRMMRWQNLLIESIHASRDGSLKSVMIASALGGEGKTSLACHLATSLARSGRRTLLIDCDLRRPSVHRLFDLPPSPGTSELLRGDCRVMEAIQHSGIDGLDVITAGHCDVEALRALARDEFGPLFARVGDGYDFVVVDTSPILPVTDALLVGQHVDAVLFSIMREVSRAPKVHAAYGKLAALDIRLLGAVVTGEHQELYCSDYNYGVPMQGRG